MTLNTFTFRFEHKLGLTRRVVVHATSVRVAEQLAWTALLLNNAPQVWRQHWFVVDVLVVSGGDDHEECMPTCPECGWSLPARAERCAGCNYPNPIHAELAGSEQSTTLAQEDAR